MDPVPDDAAERFAQARCDARARCECVAPLDVAACREHYRNAFEDGLAALEEPTFSNGCFEEILAFYDSAECDVAAEVGFSGRPRCRLTAGSSAAECTSFNGFAFFACDCRSDLSCVNGQCRASSGPMAPRQLGEPCSPETSCAVDLYCDAALDACLDRPQPGDPCTQDNACEFDFYCRGLHTGAGTCESRLGIGDACDASDGQYVCDLLCLDAGGDHCQPIACADGVCAAPEPFVCSQTLAEEASEPFLGAG